MSRGDKANFEDIGSDLDLWPEVGSRMTLRVINGVGWKAVGLRWRKTSTDTPSTGRGVFESVRSSGSILRLKPTGRVERTGPVVSRKIRFAPGDVAGMGRVSTVETGIKWRLLREKENDMEIKREDYEEGSLACPHCDGTYTHHTKVQVFTCSEDMHEQEVLIDGTGTVSVFPSNNDGTRREGNPSRRRQGIRIGLYCESCNGLFDLTIAQHKGNTLIDTERKEGNGPMEEPEE